MKSTLLIKTSIASLIFAIAGLVGAYSFGVYKEAILPPVPGATPKPSIFEGLVEPVAETVNECDIHVSYNSLTDNTSKVIAKRDGEAIYILSGSSNQNNKLFQCLVSREFFEHTRENSRVIIPCSQCREIKP